MSYRDKIIKYADARGPLYIEVAKQLHANPEVSNYEFFAQKILSELLEKEGFEVVKDIAGHRTGFLGIYKSKKLGPVVGFLAEYDALEGIGHACGHNLFGPTSLLAAAALKQVIDEVGGEIRVFGTPGEEGGENGSAKANYVKAGLFNDVDFALCIHPGSDKHLLTSDSLACAPVEVEFHGRASHAASAPEKGINALDAVIQVFNSVNALRQHLPNGVRIHGIITKGGQAPNIVPDYAQAKFFLRALDVKTLEDVYQKFEDIVKGAELATGAKGAFKPSSPLIADTVLVPSLDQVYKEALESLGAIVSLEERKSFGSTDVGNVSQVIPTIQPRIRISETPVAGHSIEKKAACISPLGLSTVVLGAKALALSALRLIEDPELLAEVKADHQRSVKLKQSH